MWEPMNTAPHDGTPVLLYATRLGWPGHARVCGFFHQRQWRLYGCANGEPGPTKREPQVLDQVEPIFWQPLPAVPNVKAAP